jgi:hypothetical protein
VLVAGEAVVRADPQAPGEAGGAAVELLVEPVPEAADRLGDGDGGGDDVEQLGDGEPATARDDRTGEDSGDEAAGDAEAAFPDGEDVEPSALEALVVGDDVVEPGPDQSARDRPPCEAADVGGVAAPGRPSPLSDPHGGNDADGDAEPVSADLERPDVDGVGRGARQRGDEADGSGHRQRAWRGLVGAGKP